MVQSMTAFGQSTTKTEQGEISCEIRSLNQRNLDLSVRLPERLRSVDDVLRGKISKLIHRGRVEIKLNVSGTFESAERLVLNEQLLEQLVDAIAKVNALPIPTGQCDPLEVLQWPGVTFMEASANAELTGMLLQVFDEALDDFRQSRKREGELIAYMIVTRAEQLSTLIAQLQIHRPTVVQRQRDKLLSTLEQLGIEHDTLRLEQELVYAAQRLDIDEELDRLQAHLQELSLVLGRTEPVGRRLDFLMQELHREANTIASKSSDSATTRISIDMKVLIEQMREQVQNVE